MVDPNDEYALIDALVPHLESGRVGYAGLFSPQQLNYHQMWSALVEEIAAISNEDFDNEVIKRIRERMHQIVDEGGNKIETAAINTTFHGKTEIYVNHSASLEEEEYAIECVLGIGNAQKIKED